MAGGIPPTKRFVNTVGSPIFTGVMVLNQATDAKYALTICMNTGIFGCEVYTDVSGAVSGTSS
jgi:hypothetical protein